MPRGVYIRTKKMRVNLSISLIGRGIGRDNINWNGGTSEYVNHGEMKRKRIEKMLQTKNKCEDCGSYANIIHHKDFTKNNHSIDNLIVLCHKCHAIYHKEVIGRPRKYSKYSIEEINNRTGICYQTIRKYFTGHKITECKKNKLDMLTK